MGWFKTAQLQLGYNIHFDPQVFERPGFPSWKDKIKDINNKRNDFRQNAEKIATKNGHILFPWTCMNSTMCRKCGRTIYLHNIHGSSDVNDMEGRALTQLCDVSLENAPDFSRYDVQDYNGQTVI